MRFRPLLSYARSMRRARRRGGERPSLGLGRREHYTMVAAAAAEARAAQPGSSTRRAGVTCGREPPASSGPGARPRPDPARAPPRGPGRRDKCGAGRGPLRSRKGPEGSGQRRPGLPSRPPRRPPPPPGEKLRLRETWSTELSSRGHRGGPSVPTLAAGERPGGYDKGGGGRRARSSPSRRPQI